MGYACPVCEAPQADGEHLANHLAFSALLGHADHEAWLDEHAPDWSEADPEGLAAAVTDLAEPVEYQEVFEEASGTAPELVDDPVRGPAGPAGPSSGSLDARTREVIEEAQRLSDGLWRGGAADAGVNDADEPADDADATDGDGTATPGRDDAVEGDDENGK